MCGRFTETEIEALLELRYGARAEFQIKPSYNISPSAMVPVLLNEEPSQFQELQWGLLPMWHKAKSRGIINVRAESFVEKHTFRKSLREKRCLIPATGFYEWKAEGGKKQPYYIQVSDEPLFSFAGIWSEDKDKVGETVRTFAIITTEANEFMRTIHDRMPVILPREREMSWLEDGLSESEAIQYLRP
jgi:putative SOS response-associated peptidase YedK